MKEYAEKFYKSKEWKKCREAFIATLPDKTCPRCKERKGKIVHHKIEITPENISDPMITLNFENLEYICQTCHTQEHLKGKSTKDDVEFDEEGNLIMKKSPPIKKVKYYA